MTETPDLTTCPEAASVRPDPFQALQVHFGMLLGVDDFRVLQGHPWGKSRLHNAWLHREGVVWGYGVSVDPARGEVRVKPGLALDEAGHELHLDGDSCLDVAAWVAKRLEEKDPDFLAVFRRFGADRRAVFDARVVIRYHACSSREIPAFAEPCEGSGGATVASRLQETVEVLMLAGPAPERSVDAPYPRLRLLFALRDPAQDENGVVIPSDKDVVARRDGILALPPAEQPKAYLQAFRDFAALDEIELRPVDPYDADAGPIPLYPGTDHAPVVLANLRGILLDDPGDGTFRLRSVKELDVTVRPSHVATATIQELLCGPLFALLAGTIPPSIDGPAPDGTGPAILSLGAPPGGPRGPRVVPGSAHLDADKKLIALQVDRPLHPATVHRDAFDVQVLKSTAGSWTHAGVASAHYEEENGVYALTVRLSKLPAGEYVRFLARGTGSTPLLGADLAPLAGAGDPSPADGSDFVAMFRRT